MRENRLRDDVIEYQTDCTAIKRNAMEEPGILDSNLIRPDLPLDGILDQPAIGFDPTIVSGLEIGDQEATRTKRSATKIK